MATHDSIVAGHHGLARTYQMIRQRFYWQNMFRDISVYIQTCIACQQNTLPDRRLHKDYLIPIPCRSIFDRISLDIMGPLPRDKDNNTHV
jgi:hypothetical protein